jgi:hypothetical protein
MQNLNLYQIEKAVRTGPHRPQLLGGLAILVLLCLGHGVWQGWQLRIGAARLAQAQNLEQQQLRQLEEAKASFVQPVLDAQLPLRLAEMEAQNRALTCLVSYLQALARQQRSGFVAPLAALAEQHPPSGLWLKTITLHEGGAHIRLQGLAQNQQMLPEYLGRLGQNAAFKGREFARFNVQRGEDQLLHFDLSSRATDPKDIP